MGAPQVPKDPWQSDQFRKGLTPRLSMEIEAPGHGFCQGLKLEKEKLLLLACALEMYI